MSLLPNYGWVQNTSNLSTVRDTINLVPDHGITHLDLIEEIKNFRENNGGLPNSWTWDARCRIKAIHATGLVNLSRNIQGYVLTDLGRRLKEAPLSDEYFRNKRILTEEEKEIYREGLLTNPPVIRILELMHQDFRGQNNGLTKYDIGKQLGFAGDIGFTHHDPYWVARNGYSFNNKEGDSDKWARTIARWLEQVDWVTKGDRYFIHGQGIRPYKLNPDTIDSVEGVLRYSINRIIRNVPAEMLCSQHHPFPELIKKRRSLILRVLSDQNYSTREDIINYVQNEGVNIDENTVQFEIINLRQAGFRITNDGGHLSLLDNINLDAPAIEEVEETDEIERLVEEYVVKCENTIPPLLVGDLIRYGYDGSAHNDFEEKVSEYFRFLGYNVEEYGQGAGATADCLIKYVDQVNYARSYGVIVDAKATSSTYSIPTGDRRSMKEYINTHGPELAREAVTNHAFSFVSSKVSENPEEQLEEIANDTGVDGTAIEVIRLLDLGIDIKQGNISINNLFRSFTSNSIFNY